MYADMRMALHRFSPTTRWYFGPAARELMLCNEQVAARRNLCSTKNMKQRLPIGIQDFVKLREEGYRYVDKTTLIHQLVINAAGPYFLSRPRRFGKSLLCSTLGALFEGRRELFAAAVPLARQPALAAPPVAQAPLAIDALEWDWKRYPVIYFDLNMGNYTTGVEELFITLDRTIELCAATYDVPLTGVNSGDRFYRLIKSLYDRYGERVAVIIDEYDKPLLATIDQKALHEKTRDALKAFYSVLKSADKYLKFVFLTGVTKFSHVSIFSDLNNITDISLDPRYAEICGVTQEELERDFTDEISEVLQNRDGNRETYLAELKRFYNGYRFSRKPLTVYNPYGLLKHFDSAGEFESYWFESATPTFLIKLIENQHLNILDLGNQTASYADFGKYDVENMEAVPILYQSGYLTITGYNNEESVFTLDYPNAEVRASFSGVLTE
jgi:hypothetical protein